MTETYTTDGIWLVRNGERVLCVEGASVSEMDAVALKYQEQADAPKMPIENMTYIADISPRQIRMALTQAGLRDAVEAAVAAGNQNLKDWYEFSTTFERKNAHVIAMSVALGVNDAELDSLWALGATL